MGVADPAALDRRDDRHARRQLALLRLHAQDSGIAVLESSKHFVGGGGDRPRGDALDQDLVDRRTDACKRGRDAGGNFSAGLVGDQRDLFSGLDGEADLDGVTRAGLELRRKLSKDCHDR